MVAESRRILDRVQAAHLFLDEVEELLAALVFVVQLFGLLLAGEIELDLASEEETKKLNDENESGKELLDFIKEKVGGLHAVKYSAALGDHPAALSSEGGMTIEMARVLSKMPDADSQLSASLVLELNAAHPAVEKIKELYSADKELCAKHCRILANCARVMSGLEIEDPEEFGNLICELLA